MCRRSKTLHQPILILFVCALIIILINYSSVRHTKCSSCPTLINSTRPMIFSNNFSNTEDESIAVDDLSILCLELAHRFDSEQNLPQTSVIFPPSFSSSKTFRFPYRYSHWKSSPILPRAFSRCEHTLAMHLLTIIDRLCRQHNITYFIYEGTLLGSIRHHDIIPWDDDVDIMVPYQQREIFADAFKKINKTLIGLVMNYANTPGKQYYKLSYKNTPSAGGYKWHFPFVDIFFYEQDQSSLWSLQTPDTKIRKRHVFPLVLRPLGQLWLPAPRNPKRLFGFDPFDECRIHYWNHRIETGQKVVTAKCNRLRDIYPFVVQNNKTDWVEILKINNTVIHTVIFKKLRYGA
ncbi:unnamed protein product [Adineta steineri]|uniref:LicD/FKTN/FKRP nucleotidyltransferase domain-containing protein n=1 Tax=Adineta steineri TaxID=433720 RepID=A0A814G0F6_9BILA|nr:unnamed protein product [Adineta steineri]